jgi:hypothetical protein
MPPHAVTRPPQWPPNTVGRYRNTDPVLINYLNRLGHYKSAPDGERSFKRALALLLEAVPVRR